MLSMDEKTSIQARGASVMKEMPPEPKSRAGGLETEYDRNGALQYLVAAGTLHRGMVLGRCEAKTGIEPFGRLDW